MKSTPKRFGKKILFPGIAGAFLLFLMSSSHAQAAEGVAGTIISAIGSAVIGNVCYAIGYIIAAVFGIFIAIDAWFIGIALNINANALQSTIVQNGFSISLSIANLAFVLGIIVIAIATILRRESYGIKQLLWKLVVMAVLVNFGLVIMAPIFGLANDFTQYFVNCISPTSGGCSSSGSGLTSYNNFATTFTAAFNPQNSFTSLNNSSANAPTNTYNGAFGIGASVASLVIPIFGIFFLVINIVLIHFVLISFIILLLIRYLYISILAILLPFAWASWVFPSFSSHFEAWWKKFLQWTFFSPVVMFFIYLALQSMATNGTNASLVKTYTTGDGAVIWGPISSFLSGAFSAVVLSFLQEVILVGLIIGGFIAAGAMGIKFADTAVKTAKGAATGAAKWGAKRTAQGSFRAMSRMVRPRDKVSDDGGLDNDITRMNRLRGRLANRLQGASESKELETKGLMSSMYNGAKSGSGLFGKGHGGGHGDDDHGGGDHGGGGGGGHGGGGHGSSGGGGGHGVPVNANANAAAGGGHGGGAHGEDYTKEQASAELDRQGFGGGNTSQAPAQAAAPAQAPAESAKNNAAAKLDAMGFGGGNASARAQAPAATASAAIPPTQPTQPRHFSGDMHTDRPSTTNSSNTQQTTAAAPATGSSSAPAPTSARPVIKVNVEAPDQPDIKINQRTAINVNQPPVPSPSAGTPHSTLGRGVVIEMKKPTSDTGAKIEETNRTTENDKAA